ncbi:uncharacterized protein J7T54_005855 [Emericellopsis cladophorae]|uniref:Glycosyltransferase family 28 N-terminal domain-containing protein n=1 Tax=Emericellopsis cladophorae TaxID=2686198 RepID=A0A9P9XVT3_9HYPO|nr:uncharacterized protein J7T54_005855 [Emericellopsis cladophorae]KAI6778752.1 hypothetical protein J7T54_005855 [Emericellopsis cladophorae]
MASDGSKITDERDPDRSTAADAPPSYDLASEGNLLTEVPKVREDGRIKINLDWDVIERLSLLSIHGPPSLPPKDGQSSAPPPYSSGQHGEDDQQPFPIKLNIAIQVVGSRGDVQPFVALGAELQKHGHRVRLATHNAFDRFVRDAGLEFFPIGGDPAELMAYMVRNPGLIPSMQSLRAGDIKKKRAMMSEILRGCWRSCISPDPVSNVPFVADAIIANPPSFAHIHCAQALGIPVHMMFTMPWTSTEAFPHPLVNMELGKSSATKHMSANYLSYAVVEVLTWQGLGDIINEWRESIDLEHIAFSEGPRLAETLNVPFTYCWSPALVPKPRDWGNHIDVCGFFFREAPSYTPPPELEKFLAAGPPPIYIGFGSIVVDDPSSLSEMILEAVRITGTRALISRGWSKLDGAQSTDVMFLDDCPHEWLFQHVRAVVHHGGAANHFLSQPFWGDMVAAAGAGPSPIPQKSLDVSQLVEAIQYCLTKQAASAAERIAVQMQSESGVQQAVKSFHSNLPRDLLECDVIKGQPAAWTYSRKRTNLKLSKAAAEVLLSHLKVDKKGLELHESRRTVIQTRRWDPFTGTIGAALGVSADLARAAADTVVKPVKVYHQRKKDTDTNTSPDLTAADMVTLRGQGPTSVNGGAKSRHCLSTARTMAAISGNGAADFLKRLSSGAIIVPFAFTEGLRHLPHLYGENVRDYGEIRDWKSGAAAGGKCVVLGLYDGVAGLILLPYSGAQRQGAIGAVKGVGKGIAGLGSNVFTAVMGVATYPLQGIYKSILHTAHSNTRRSVEAALLLEGKYLADRRREVGLGDSAVMEHFDAISKGRPGA